MNDDGALVRVRERGRGVREARLLPLQEVEVDGGRGLEARGELADLARGADLVGRAPEIGTLTTSSGRRLAGSLALLGSPQVD